MTAPIANPGIALAEELCHHREQDAAVTPMDVGYLPLRVAYHKGFYKDEGIELEIILMPTNVINTAALTGQIDVKKFSF